LKYKNCLTQGAMPYKLSFMNNVTHSGEPLEPSFSTLALSVPLGETTSLVTMKFEVEFDNPSFVIDDSFIHPPSFVTHNPYFLFIIAT